MPIWFPGNKKHISDTFLFKIYKYHQNQRLRFKGVTGPVLFFQVKICQKIQNLLFQSEQKDRKHALFNKTFP